MMKLAEIFTPKLVEFLSKPQLDKVEEFADSLWRSLNVDVKFTRHFLERVNDKRNGEKISVDELTHLFKKEYEAYGDTVAKLPDSHEAVFKDLVTKLNLPFVIVDRAHDKELIAKTVLRKDNFKTTNQEFPIH